MKHQLCSGHLSMQAQTRINDSLPLIIGHRLKVYITPINPIGIYTMYWFSVLEYIKTLKM